ncbi:MAG: PKD domain-containing protein [Chitinophagales bacterium]|nr:PKD domain-containing protein [Chitinophagales bacterium]
MSQNLYVNGTAPNQSNITSVPGNPPVITVLNNGCANAEVQFSSTSPGSWNFGAGANPPTATGVGPIHVLYSTTGRKTITFNGTVFTDFIDIFTNPLSGSTITHTNNPATNGCPDTFTTTLTGSFYEWEFGSAALPPTASGATLQSTSVVFTTPGTYKVIVWVTTPCCGRVKDSLTITVQPNTLPISLSASANSVCAGQPITYTASPANYIQYTFIVNGTPVQTSASNTYVANGLQQGDSVVVLGFNGICYSNPSSVHYPTIIPVPTVTITSSDADNTICSGELITFTATPAGYDNYAFYNGSSLQQSGPSNVWSTTQLGQGNSVYCIATENGCNSPQSNVIVTIVNPTPFVTISTPNTTICDGDNITITASPAGLDNYQFFVNGNPVQNSNSNTYSSSSFNNGDVITVIGTLNNCPSPLSPDITLTVNPLPSVTLNSSDADNSICEGETITFTANPPGYTSYQFLNNGTVLQNTSSHTYTTSSLQPGNSITVIAVNNGCTGAPSNAVNVAVQPAPVVNAGADAAACIDAGAQTLNGFSPPGGTWSGTGITNPAGEFTPASAGAGAWWIYYYYADPSTGCSGRDSVRFTVFALPNIGLASSVNICEGDGTTLNASGGTTYNWSPATGLSSTSVANPTASPTTTTTYNVTVTDANNCSNSAAITVNVNPNPVPSFTVQDVCAGQPSVFINNTTPPNASFSWSFGDGNTSAATSPSHTYADSGTYIVTLTATLGGCSVTYTNTATVHPAAQADFSANPLTGYSDASSPIVFTNLSTHSDSWSWNFGDGKSSTAQSPAHIYEEPGIYTVSLTAYNPYGCNSTITKTNYIQIFELPRVFIPTAFSPNGDGANDVLRVLTSGTKYFQFKLYNRWGEKVFETNNSLDGWDGKYKGIDQPMGVYVYTLNVAFEDNTTRVIKGSVTLLR